MGENTMKFKKFFVGQLLICTNGEFCVVIRRTDTSVWISHEGDEAKEYKIWLDNDGGEHITIVVDFETIHRFPAKHLNEKINIPPLFC